VQFFSIEELCYMNSTQQWAAIWWLFGWSNPEKRTTFTLLVDVVDFKKQMNPQQLANILLKK